MPPRNVLSDELQLLVDAYIKSMSVKEHKAYLIAESHLGYSFQIEKSVGFLKWRKENNM